MQERACPLHSTTVKKHVNYLAIYFNNIQCTNVCVQLKWVQEGGHQQNCTSPFLLDCGGNKNRTVIKLCVEETFDKRGESENEKVCLYLQTFTVTI